MDIKWGGDYMLEVSLRGILAPSFYEVHRDIKEKKHVHYWLKRWKRFY